MCKGDLKQGTLEERIYRTYWGDGTLDLIIGLVIMGIGLGWLWDLVIASAILPAVAIPLWISARKLLIEPRMGAVTFGEPRRQKERRGMAWLILAGILVLLLVMAGIISGISRGNEMLSRLFAPGIPAMLIGLAGILSGLMFQISRLMVYGLAGIAIGLLGAIVTGFEPPILIMAAGLLPFFAGGALLIRFLGQYPKPDGREDPGEGL